MRYIIAIAAIVFCTPALAQEASLDLLKKLPDIIRGQCDRALNADASYEAQLLQALEKSQVEIKRLTDKYETKK